MKVIITGSVAFDHIMSMPGRFKDHIMPDKIHMLNVSFLMNKLRREKGGTGGNMAYGLGLLRVKSKLIASVGADFELEYRAHLESVGVDTSQIKVCKDLVSATGFVMTDRDDNQIWGFFEGAMKQAIRLTLKKLVNEDELVVIGPNDPKAMAKYVTECSSFGYLFLFDPAFQIPNLPVEELRLGVNKARVLIGNDYEIILMLKKTGLKKSQLLKKDKILITTLGSSGSLIETNDKKLKIPVVKPKNISDPTGAGDAYRSGFVTGYINNLPLAVCGRIGALAAVYTVEEYGTQTHKFSLSEFKKRYKENFGESLDL
ncbi:MAG: carbohydrate kinase family protein [Candidatus Beckwithbacteria bacterium]|nr:carbohydrate kinase family protein [Patescibacteria group bacterium]